MQWKQRAEGHPVDGCGMGCFSTTALVIWFNGFFVTTYFVLYPWLGLTSKFYLTFFGVAFLSVMTFWAQFAAAFGDPGFVPNDARPVPADVRDRFLRRCRTCDTFKPNRARHCSTCGHCVVKIDHHCPFINNCVGMLNQKFFLLFVVYGTILGVYTSVCVALRYFFCLGNPLNPCTDGLTAAAMSLVNILVAMIFCVFSTCVLCDQCQSIASPTKYTMGSDMGPDPEVAYRTNLREIFGGHGSFNLSWLVPTTPKYKYFEDMVGFASKTSPWTSNKPDEQRRVLTL